MTPKPAKPAAAQVRQAACQTHRPHHSRHRHRRLRPQGHAARPQRQTRQRPPARRHACRAHAPGRSQGSRRAPRLLPNFDRVSVGFPGVIKRGTTCTAANLHPKWVGFPLPRNLRSAGRSPSASPTTPPSRAMAPSGQRRRARTHPRHRHGLVSLHRWPSLSRPRTRPPSLAQEA